MSEITTYLFRLYKDDFIHRLKLNEFWNGDRLTFYSDDYAFIKKIMKYDKDTERVTNEFIFWGEVLDNPLHDKIFKKAFVNKFIKRQIGKQTREAYSEDIISIFVENKLTLNAYFEHFDDMFANGSTTTHTLTKDLTGDNRTRGVIQSLPQDNVELDLNNDVYPYADSGTGGLSNSKVNENLTELTEVKNYSPEQLNQLNNYLARELKKYERAHLLIW